MSRDGQYSISRFLKLIALVTVFVFTATTVSWSAPALPGQLGTVGPASVDVANPITVPAEWGFIRELHLEPLKSKKSSNGFLIHIQDAHGNMAAQKNIHNLLNYLAREKKIDLIALEGADAKLDPSLFDFFPYKELNDIVRDKLFDAGELSGVEYFSLEGARVPPLYGVDDRALYIENLKTYREVIKNEKANLKIVSRYQARLGTIASHILKGDLAKFMRMRAEYEQGRASLLYYINGLKGLARYHLSLDLNDPRNQDVYPNLTRLFTIQRLDKEMDRRAVYKDAMAFLDHITPKLKEKKGKDDIVARLDNTLFMLNGSHKRVIASEAKQSQSSGIASSPSAPRNDGVLLFEERFVLEYLYEILAEEDVAIKSFPNFQKYVAHRILTGELENEETIAEIQKLEMKIEEALLKTEKEKTLLTLWRNLTILKKACSLKLGRDEYSYYREHRSELDSGEIESRLAMLTRGGCRKTSVLASSKEEAGPFATPLTETLPLIDKFYRLAEERDNALIKNTLSHIKETKAKNAVLITGGFHTEGISEICKENNLAYCVIAPRVGKDKSNDNYRSIIMDEPSVLERGVFSSVSTMSTVPMILLHYGELAIPDKQVPNRRARTVPKVINFAYGQMNDIAPEYAVSLEGAQIASVKRLNQNPIFRFDNIGFSRNTVTGELTTIPRSRIVELPQSDADVVQVMKEETLAASKPIAQESKLDLGKSLGLIQAILNNTLSLSKRAIGDVAILLLRFRRTPFLVRAFLVSLVLWSLPPQKVSHEEIFGLNLPSRIVSMQTAEAQDKKELDTVQLFPLKVKGKLVTVNQVARQVKYGRVILWEWVNDIEFEKSGGVDDGPYVNLIGKGTKNLKGDIVINQSIPSRIYRLEVKPKTAYKVTAYVKLGNISEKGIVIGVVFDQSGPQYKIKRVDGEPSEWVKVEHSVEAGPKDAKIIRFVVGPIANAKGKLGVDKISIEESVSDTEAKEQPESKQGEIETKEKEPETSAKSTVSIENTLGTYKDKPIGWTFSTSGVMRSADKETGALKQVTLYSKGEMSAVISDVKIGAPYTVRVQGKGSVNVDIKNITTTTLDLPGKVDIKKDEVKEDTFYIKITPKKGMPKIIEVKVIEEGKSLGESKPLTSNYRLQTLRLSLKPSSTGSRVKAARDVGGFLGPFLSTLSPVERKLLIARVVAGDSKLSRNYSEADLVAMGMTQSQAHEVKRFLNIVSRVPQVMFNIFEAERMSQEDIFLSYLQLDMNEHYALRIIANSKDDFNAMRDAFKRYPQQVEVMYIDENTSLVDTIEAILFDSEFITFINNNWDKTVKDAFDLQLCTSLVVDKTLATTIAQRFPYVKIIASNDSIADEAQLIANGKEHLLGRMRLAQHAVSQLLAKLGSELRADSTAVYALLKEQIGDSFVKLSNGHYFEVKGELDDLIEGLQILIATYVRTRMSA